MKHPTPAPPGYSVYHQKKCATRRSRKCNCRPTWEPWVYSARQQKKIRKRFKSYAAAKSWRRDALVAIGRGELMAPTRTTVKQAGDAWLAGAMSGAILHRGMEAFKPSTLRGYRWALEKHIYPALGAVRLADLRRRDVQDLAEKLLAGGASPSSVRNVLMPLRVLCERAVDRNELGVNPCARIKLPPCPWWSRPRRRPRGCYRDDRRAA